MLKKIDHIGIAVIDLGQALAVYRDILGFREVARETVEAEGVSVVCLEAGDDRIELLEPLDASSPVAKFIGKRGEGVHHIALEVDDIEAKIAALQEQGMIVLGDAPRIGVGGKRIAFLHPKSANGVLVELTQKGSNE